MTVAQSEPAVNQPASPPSLVDEYDLGDTTPEPQVEATSVPGSAAGAAAPELPERNPANGRFLPAQKSPVLIRRAQEMGLSDAEIDDLDVASLDTLVWHLARTHRETQRAASHDEIRREALEKKQPPAQAQAGQEDPISDLGQELADFDPALTRIFQRQQEMLKGLRAELDQIKQFTQSQQQRSLAEQIDGAFQRLGRPEIFGTGRRSELREGSPELSRRMAVLQVAQGQTSGSVEERIGKAIEILYGRTSAEEPEDQGQQPRRSAQPERYTAQQWAEATLARPTHRQPSAEPPGDRKAVRTAARKLQEMGEGVPEGDDELNGFLG